MEHISESGSLPHSCLTVSLPISVIRFDVLYHLFSIPHRDGFIALFRPKAAERGSEVTKVSLLHRSDSHNLNVMLFSSEMTFSRRSTEQEITCAFGGTSVYCP